MAVSSAVRLLSAVVQHDAPQPADSVRAAEVIAALCLATDLALGLPFEHGLHSTLFAMRLGERLGVGAETASRTYYACLLFYSGCTADAETAAELFPDETALLTHFTPVMFGSRPEVMAGVMRALAVPGSPRPARAVQVARTGSACPPPSATFSLISRSAGTGRASPAR